MVALVKAGSNDLGLSQSSARADSRGCRGMPSFLKAGSIDLSLRHCSARADSRGCLRISRSSRRRPPLFYLGLPLESFIISCPLWSSPITPCPCQLYCLALFLWTVVSIMGFDCGCAFAVATPLRNFAQMGHASIHGVSLEPRELIEIHHSSNEVISLAPGRLLTTKHVRLQGEALLSVEVDIWFSPGQSAPE